MLLIIGKKGNIIKIFTARGSSTVIDWKEKNNLTFIVISHDEYVLKWCDNLISI